MTAQPGMTPTPSLSLLMTQHCLITDNDETAYREEVREHAPILIDGALVEQVESFKSLGVHITNKLTNYPLDTGSYFTLHRDTEVLHSRSQNPA
jgi:hypothetical protein